MKLLNYIPPYPDELFISSFLRNLSINAFDLPSFERNLYNRNSYGYKTLSLELRRFFLRYIHTIGIDFDAGSYLLNTSILPFSLLFMTPEYQAERLNAFFCDVDDRHTSPSSLIRTINICPKCIEDDRREYGYAYYHRSHQLPGVSVCPDHFLPLQTFGTDDERKEKICNFDFDFCEEIADIYPLPDRIAYAEYAREFLVNPVNSDINKIKEVVLEEFAERGYTPENIHSVLRAELDKWPHKSLIGKYHETFILWLASKRKLDPQTVLPFLMLLFPNPADLAVKIETGNSIIQKYTCKAGHEYYLTRFAKINGWGCPECDKTIPEKKLAQRIVDAIGNEEYAVISNVCNCGQEYRIGHKYCERDFPVSFKSFAKHKSNCSFGSNRYKIN